MSQGTSHQDITDNTAHGRDPGVCYFGTYKPKHTRNLVNIAGLRANGVRVLECRVESIGLIKHWDLFRAYIRMRGTYDTMIVGFNGRSIMPIAWLVTRFPRKKLVLDAFTSSYDSAIFDRKKYSPYGPTALRYWLVDWVSCHLADLVLMDSEAHAEYMRTTFHLRPKRVRGLPVGCPDDTMYPRLHKHSGEDFVVHFHGTHIRTQGVPYILEAAEMLQGKHVMFNIVGKISDYAESIESTKRLGLHNVRFFDYMPYEKLAACMAEADICLGAFGDTEKAKRTGAFKVVEAMAMRKPVITGESPALKEFLTDRKNVLFCSLANGKDLADKIEELKDNESLRSSIAEHGYELYISRFTPRMIGRELFTLITSL